MIFTSYVCCSLRLLQHETAGKTISIEHENRSTEILEEALNGIRTRDLRDTGSSFQLLNLENLLR